VQTPLSSQDLHEEALGLRQMEGLERALSLPPYGFLAVEGSPGTGKTSIIAAAASEIATAGGKVLITSLTNVAVDNAIESILAEDLRSGNTSPEQATQLR
jgi:Mrp family chromosome partitioning ATPase